MKNVDIGWDYYHAKASFLARRHGLLYKLLDVMTSFSTWQNPERIRDIIWHVVYDS